MGNKINAFVFDAYGTLFDVYSVKKACSDLYKGKGEELGILWRDKQVEYSFLRQLMGQYRPFREVTRDALRYAVNKLQLSFDSEKETALMDAYEHLEVYPEVKEVLRQLKSGSKTTAIFSNGSRDMLDPLMKNTEMSAFFDSVISVDRMKQYKPAPASYMQVINELHVAREDVLFMSCNGWDISGAKSFGFNTAWINRHNLPVEQLGQHPDCIYNDLNGILDYDTPCPK